MCQLVIDSRMPVHDPPGSGSGYRFTIHYQFVFSMFSAFINASIFAYFQFLPPRFRWTICSARYLPGAVRVTLSMTNFSLFSTAFIFTAGKSRWIGSRLGKVEPCCFAVRIPDLFLKAKFSEPGFVVCSVCCEQSLLQSNNLPLSDDVATKLRSHIDNIVTSLPADLQSVLTWLQHHRVHVFQAADDLVGSSRLRRKCVTNPAFFRPAKSIDHASWRRWCIWTWQIAVWIFFYLESGNPGWNGFVEQWFEELVKTRRVMWIILNTAWDHAKDDKGTQCNQGSHR